MSNYILYSNELDQLFETKYNKGKRYIKFIYNGYKNDDFSKPVSEFSRFLLIDTKTQRMTLTDRSVQAINFLVLSCQEYKELLKDLDELIEKYSRPRMLLTLRAILINKL